MTGLGSADVLSGQSRFVFRLVHMGMTRLVFSIAADSCFNATEAASGTALTRELQMAAFAMVLICNPNIENWQCFPVYSCCFMCGHPQELECLLAGCECGPIYFSLCLRPQDVKEAESQQTPPVVDSSSDCSPDCVQGKSCTLMTATCEWI